MLMGQVVGNIVSTRKHESLVGSKILEVKLLHENKDIDEFMIAIDCGRTMLHIPPYHRARHP